MEHVDEFGRYIGSIRQRDTALRYVASTRQFLNWLNDKGFSELVAAPRDALATYVAELSAEGRLPATVGLQVASINRYLKWCQLKGIEIPDFHPPELPKKQKATVKDILTPKTLRQYFELADNLREPMRTAVTLLPCMGLRSNEMVTLPLKCFRRTSLKLKDSTRKEVITAVVKGKGGYERYVPVLDEGEPAVMEFINGWRAQHSDIKWFFPGRKCKSLGLGYHRHVSSRVLRAAVREISGTLGVEFSPHTMRRTYLTFLYHRGVEPVMLAKIAGHRDVKTLMNFYLYLDEIDINAAVHNAGGKLTGDE